MPPNDFTIQDLWEEAGFHPNPNQEEAILHVDGPLFLPAGPGSGKTRVLLWRTLNLIVFQDVSPDEIYLSTFTEKAAHQLNEGLRFYLSIATNRNGHAYDISRMYVGTIHSLCHRILTDRRFSVHRRRHQQPSLLDQLGQYFFISRTWRWADLVHDLDLGEDLDVINTNIIQIFDPSYHYPSRHRAVTNCIAFFNRLSEECIDPNQAIGEVDDEKLIALLCMYDRYLKSLVSDGQVPRTDFSMMQQDAYRTLLAVPDSGNVFKHVIIDEYQDTNPIQEKLIFKLGEGSKNICVVGDDDQALYRFRGATVENFVDFPDKCVQYLGTRPRSIPLDTNYRSRRKIVTIYSDFLKGCNWQRKDNPQLQHRVSKEIQAHREDDGPSVVASTPGSPDEVCPQIASFVKQLLDAGKVEDPNQIAFLFPSLKSVQVQRLRTALEALGLQVYAPRARSFLYVQESIAVFGVLLHVFGKPVRGFFPGMEYNDYFDWIDSAYKTTKEIIESDHLLAQFIQDRKAEITASRSDYQILTGIAERRGWDLKQPYVLAEMKRVLNTAPGLSDHAKRNLSNRYFDQVVELRQQQGNPVSLSYVITRSTSLDWTILDFFYRLCAFTHFKSMFDEAEAGKEASICNLSLISQYLARFMDEFRTVISADLLLEDRYQHWLFGSYLYTIFRLGESEYENPEDPFPKGSIPFLTIHQAKGLEFPVVVFGNPRKSKKGVQRVEEIVHPLIKREGEPLDRIPEFDMMRLFYVALSRAKNLLVIPHWQSPNNRVSEPLLSLLDDDHVIRIPDFDLGTMPDAKLEKDDLPKNYSYTADYLLYQKCPRQYMIFRKYGFVPSRSQTMFFGNLVHQTLEDLHHFLIQSRASNEPN
jgi:DNA helicase-2/ATP-dependent DNA helicase PcrA